ncbi:hypothetical protein LP414_27300 [Polaromonas sp. P1(28)-13]|nr:hypothetical protein LP414_27300 [Polaromonas sp. P1(28)-13]
MSKINVVGLDPSLKNLGIANVELNLDDMTLRVRSLTLVHTEPEKDKKTRKQVRKNSEDLDRAQLLHKGLIEGVKDAWLAVAEMPVGSQSSRAMASYGVCIGVLAACPIPMIQVTATEVKKAGAGHANATKEEMIQWAVQKYPDAPWIRHTRSSEGRPDKNGHLVGAFKKGDPQACNEHLADALAAIEAGIETDQFQQIIAIMKGSMFRASAFVE